MSKVVKAQYDEQSHTLRLLEPIEGLADHEEVSVTVNPKPRWSYLENSLQGEDAKDFGDAIDEAFPIEPVRR